MYIPKPTHLLNMPMSKSYSKVEMLWKNRMILSPKAQDTGLLIMAIINTIFAPEFPHISYAGVPA